MHHTRRFKMRGGGGRSNAGRGLSLPIMLLGMELMRTGLEHIPPVTLISILFQIGIYLQNNLPFVPSISEACISAQYVWYFEDYKRIILAPFIHANDWHLYYNMVSLLVKGRSLERRFGSHYFLYILLIFTVISSGLTVGLSIVLEQITGNISYLKECSVGFSGVLFAFKVVTTHFQPSGTQHIMGFIPVPSKYAFWAELLFIQLIAPNSSFLGHLAGIITGILYIKGPLKLLDIPYEYSKQFLSGFFAGPSYTYAARTTGYHSQASNSQASNSQASNSQASNSQASNSRDNQNGNSRHSTYNHGDDNVSSRSYFYTGGLSEEEQMQEALRQSRQQADHGYYAPSAPNIDDINTNSNSANIYPDLSDITNEQNRLNEEIRRRRLERYQ